MVSFSLTVSVWAGQCQEGHVLNNFCIATAYFRKGASCQFLFNFSKKLIWSWLARTSVGVYPAASYGLVGFGVLSTCILPRKRKLKNFQTCMGSCCKTPGKNLKLKCWVRGMHVEKQGDNTLQYILEPILCSCVLETALCSRQKKNIHLGSCGCYVQTAQK